MRVEGNRFEAAAAAFLESAGYRILARNFRNRLGEIDLIVERDGVVVFVEVKGRRGADPREAISDLKVSKVRRVAESFLAMKGWLDETREVRFDALFVTGTDEGFVFDHEIAAF